MILASPKHKISCIVTGNTSNKVKIFKKHYVEDTEVPKQSDDLTEDILENYLIQSIILDEPFDDMFPKSSKFITYFAAFTQWNLLHVTVLKERVFLICSWSWENLQKELEIQLESLIHKDRSRWRSHQVGEQFVMIQGLPGS